MKRMFISIVVGLALLLGLMPAAVTFAADTGTTSGSFTVGNVVPVVTDIEMYSDSVLQTVANMITPQVEYYIKITVACPNSLADVKLVTIKLFYDTTGSVNESTITAGNPQTAAILTWTQSTGLWTIDAGSPTSWAIVSSDCHVPSDLTASSGFGVFAFKAGKVGTETVGSNYWDIHGRVTGSDDKTSGLYRRQKQMMWYGETTVNTSNVVWGVVTPGTGFGDVVNKQGNISVKYIANGAYQEKVKSSATWAGSSYTATFDATGACSDAREFSLKVWNADAYASAVQMNTTGVNLHNDSITGEAGDLEATNVLWLKLASTFQVDLYAGTITFIIANN